MNTQVKYTGSALPGNAEVVTLYATSDATTGGRFFANVGVKRFALALVNDAAGTLASQSSEDGITWTTISSDAVAASAANAENIYDFWVEPYYHWRLRWTNGATPQTSWRVAMVMSDERGPLV